MSDFKKYKYIGLPFEAFGWPGPVYNRLVGSNDGLNWDCLEKYSSSWRDCDVTEINGRYYVCATDYNIYWTDDFESFNKIPMSGKYPMAWAPEWFKDTNGTWYIFYATGDSSMTNHFIMMCRTFDPQSLVFGEPTQITFNTGNDGKIDPNVNYINGYYYLWVANQQNMEIELYRSKSLLGTYEYVQTNISQLVNDKGFTKNEAPEMLYENGTYWLYCDPWRDGLGEHDRCMYRATSKDMINWNSLYSCECTFGLRHFTPFVQNTVTSDIILWDGNPGTLETTNQHNFTVIQELVGHINQLSQTNPLFNEYDVVFDLQLLPLLNRNARVQFLNNARLLDKLMPTLIEDVLLMAGIIDYEYKKPVIPTVLYFDKALWNNYWQAVADDLGLVITAINQIIGGTN